MSSPDLQTNRINRRDISTRVYTGLTVSLMALSLYLGTPRVSYAGNGTPPPPTSSILELTGNCPGNWKKGEAKKGETVFKEYCLGGNKNNYVYTKGQSKPIVVFEEIEYPAEYTDKPHKEQQLTDDISFRMICDEAKDPGICKGGQIIIKNTTKTKPIDIPSAKSKPNVFSESIVNKPVKNEQLDNIQIIGLIGGMGLIIVLKLIISGRNNILGVKDNVMRGAGKIKGFIPKKNKN